MVRVSISSIGFVSALALVLSFALVVVVVLALVPGLVSLALSALGDLVAALSLVIALVSFVRNPSRSYSLSVCFRLSLSSSFSVIASPSPLLPFNH